jgi:hypothetical protein
MNLVKKNFCYIITIVLILLLSFFKTFHFLTESILGRFLLVSLLACIACSNKVLGLVAVLAIILAFNYNDLYIVQPYNYYEGFEGSSKEDTTSKKDIKKAADSASDAASKIIKSASLLNTSDTEKPLAREGFCMTDRERNIQKGKQSNSIPVSIYSRGNESDAISPSDKSVFSGLFSSV